MNNNKLKQIIGIMVMVIALGIVALISSLVKNKVTENWLKKKAYVTCIPADVENAHPLVYHQTALNPVQNDALVKSFVEEYTHLILNEQIVDYHKLSDNNRYDDMRLSQTKWKAINMSIGSEKALNYDRYSKSNELFYELKRGNMGWIFNIDDIIIYPGQNNGATIAIIRGQYQVTYDKVKADLPSKLWGYREIYLLIQQGNPVEGSNSKEGSSSKQGDDANKYGMYVALATINTIAPDDKKILDERASTYYLLKDNQ